MTDSSRIGQVLEVPINDFIRFGYLPAYEWFTRWRDNYNYIIRRESKEIGVVHVHIPKRCLGACG